MSSKKSEIQKIKLYHTYLKTGAIMMTSSSGTIFSVTGPLCGEFTGLRRIPLKGSKDIDAKL